MTKTPYRAIFFDLDGTLLPMELDEFMSSYFKAIGLYVAERGVEISAFKTGFENGVKAMATHDDGSSNYDAYWETFFASNDPEAIEWIDELNGFYENEFGELGKDVIPHPEAALALDVLQKKGYPLVLTTMPMFPLRAVQWRLSWAGIDHRVFKRITHYENSTSVKPKHAYYEENLKACGLKPEEVLMVGNNTKEDLACLDLGIDAYLVTNHLLNPNNFDIDQVKHGTFADFLAWIRELPECVNPVQDIATGLVGERE